MYLECGRWIPFLNYLTSTCRQLSRQSSAKATLLIEKRQSSRFFKSSMTKSQRTTSVTHATLRSPSSISSHQNTYDLALPFRRVRSRIKHRRTHAMLTTPSSSAMLTRTWLNHSRSNKTRTLCRKVASHNSSSS